MVEIIPVVYDAASETGCFEAMLKDPAYDDTLFLYNDNVIDWLNWDDDTAGKGTAKIRPNSWPYNQDRPLRVLSVPTGFSSASGGFRELDRDSKKAISLAFQRIRILVQDSPHIKRIAYSADADNPLVLGTKTFKVDPYVLSYISVQLWDMNDLITTDAPHKQSLAQIRRKELKLLPNAQRTQAAALDMMEMRAKLRKRDREVSFVE